MTWVPSFCPCYSLADWYPFDMCHGLADAILTVLSVFSLAILIVSQTVVTKRLVVCQAYFIELS